MLRVTLDIPDEWTQEFKSYQDRIKELILLGLQQVKIQEALTLYRRGVVSFGRAAEMAGMSEAEMIRQARASGVRPRWTEAMAVEEMA